MTARPGRSFIGVADAAPSAISCCSAVAIRTLRSVRSVLSRLEPSPRLDKIPARLLPMPSRERRLCAGGERGAPAPDGAADGTPSSRARALAASGDEDGPGAGDGGLVAGDGASDSSSGSIFIASRAASRDDSPHARHVCFLAFPDHLDCSVIEDLLF